MDESEAGSVIDDIVSRRLELVEDVCERYHQRTSHSADGETERE
jgi:hypothetical protein